MSGSRRDHDHQTNPIRPDQRLLPTAHSDIYTLLMLIAVVGLLTAIGFVWYYSAVLFDSANPFRVVSGSALGWVQALRR